jgi:HTH-type transcriptional regulator / antitoxin HigA
MATELKPIRTSADYEAALIEAGRPWGAKVGTPKGDRLDVLATLIDAYESGHFPFDRPDPIDAIKFRMEQMGLTRRDLEPLIGSRARVDPAFERAARHPRRDPDTADAPQESGLTWPHHSGLGGAISMVRLFAPSSRSTRNFQLCQVVR